MFDALLTHKCVCWGLVANIISYVFTQKKILANTFPFCCYLPSVEGKTTISCVMMTSPTLFDPARVPEQNTFTELNSLLDKNVPVLVTFLVGHPGISYWAYI